LKTTIGVQKLTKGLESTFQMVDLRN